MAIMNTKTHLENALKEAIRAGDDLRKRSIRMALASIQLAEVDKGAPLEEAAVLSIVQKEIKSRQETIEEARRANRPDLVESSQAEIAVLQEFLPEQLNPEELEALAKQAIADVGATNMRDMGQVMKVLAPRLEGRASGDQASQVVRRLLQ
jgi:uncharacterized protein